MTSEQTGYTPNANLYTLANETHLATLHILRVLDEQAKAQAAISNALASLQASVAAIAALIGGTAPETVTNVTFTVGPKP